MSGFEDLRVYKQSLEGVKLVYELTRRPQFKHDYSLVDQIRRASASVCANIAEAYGRRTKKDKAQFYTYAIGSVNEVVAFLDIISTIYPEVNTAEIKDYYSALGRQTYAFRRTTT